MGGIQAKASSVAEVHVVRGGTLILRVAPSQTTSYIMEARKLARKNSKKAGRLGGLASLGASFEDDVGAPLGVAGYGGSGCGVHLAGGSGGSSSVSSTSPAGPKANKDKGVGSGSLSSSSLWSSSSSSSTSGGGGGGGGGGCPCNCFLLEQSMDVLEKILMKLTPRDLALLCMTSKAANQCVRAFIDHYSSSYGLPGKFHRFFEENEPLLLPKEQVLRDRIQTNARPQLLIYSTLGHFVGQTVRVALADVTGQLQACGRHGVGVGASGVSAGPCVVRERDPAIRREVVVVKELKASCCRPKFSHLFRDVKAGLYVVQLRLRLCGEAISEDGRFQPWTTEGGPALGAAARVQEGCQNHHNNQNNNGAAAAAANHNGMDARTGSIRISKITREPGNPYSASAAAAAAAKRSLLTRQASSTSAVIGEAPAGTTGTTSSPDGSLKKRAVKEDLVCQPIDQSWWTRVHGLHHTNHLEHQFSNTRAIFDADSDWFFLRMDAFRLDKRCDVELSFEDLDTTTFNNNNNHHHLEDQNSREVRQPPAAPPGGEGGYRPGIVWDFVELKETVKLMEL